MNPSDQLVINTSEAFPHLSNAPITEAVMEIRGRASAQLNETETLNKLKTALTDYSKHDSLHGYEGEFQLGGGQEPKVVGQSIGWLGFRFASADGRHIAKFQLDSFSFSRLTPYENWKQFTDEARRLWKIHYELTHPTEIQRLGVRFINRFPIKGKGDRMDEYFKVFPDELKELNLRLGGFLHRNIFVVPSHPYAINVIKTIQPPSTEKNEYALILDIDVYTIQPFEPKNEILEQKLKEIRWLKNKSFLGIITQKLKESLS